ncbi:MAG: NAD kinase [Culicoidibacterales bacterium]
MRFATVIRHDNYSAQTKQKIVETLERHDWIYDEHHPEFIISIGGDGTMLQAFQQYQHQLQHVKFIAVHTGSLGFYTDWKVEDIDELLEAMIAKRYSTVGFPVLEIMLDGECGPCSYLALNELTISDPAKTLKIDVKIDGTHFETFRGTGLCVSTPSGSTGYNKSLGGAVIHPRVEVFQMTEIASINNKVYRTIGSPIVFYKKQYLDLSIQYSNSVTVTYDHLVHDCIAVETIQCRLHRHKAQFARFKKLPFWERVNNAFIE